MTIKIRLLQGLLLMGEGVVKVIRVNRKVARIIAIVICYILYTLLGMVTVGLLAQWFTPYIGPEFVLTPLGVILSLLVGVIIFLGILYSEGGREDN